MTAPGEVKLARHFVDIDDDGHHTATSAAAEDITIADAGNYYTGTDVEAALQEVGADIVAIEADVADLEADLAAHLALPPDSDHEHIDYVTFSGDGSTTAFELPAAPFDAYSVKAYVAGLRTAVTLSGAMLTTMTFGSPPASGTDNVVADIVAAVV